MPAEGRAAAAAAPATAARMTASPRNAVFFILELGVEPGVEDSLVAGPELGEEADVLPEAHAEGVDVEGRQGLVVCVDLLARRV